MKLFEKRAPKLSFEKKELENVHVNIEAFENNDAKTKYFTGLSHFKTLKLIYKAIEKNLPDCKLKQLNSFQILILTLLKLRLDLPFTYLGYKFNISTMTASTKFHECLFTNARTLSSELESFIRWPSVEVLKYYTPESFKKLFGERPAVIIDCFEIYIEKPCKPLILL